jgi:hypothetical protein
MAGCMLRVLEGHSVSKFHFLWTGDEPRIVCTITKQYGQRRGRKWTALSSRHIITGRQWSLFVRSYGRILLECLAPKSVHGHKALY